MHSHHPGHKTSSRLIAKQLLLVVTLLISASFFVVAAHSFSPKTAFVSPEVKFTDSSAHGMQIVPASCPSDPTSGDTPNGCDGMAPKCPDGSDAPNGNLSLCGFKCTLSPASQSIVSGTSATLNYTITGSYITSATINGATVWTYSFLNDGFPWSTNASGTYEPSPTSNTSYIMTITSQFYGSNTCGPAAVIVCGAGQIVQNGQCVSTACVPNGTLSCSGNTVVDSCNNTVQVCSAGQICRAGACVVGSCVPNGTLSCSGNTVVDSCNNTVQVCSAGQICQAGSCVARSCTPQYFCTNNNLYHQETDCSDTLVKICPVNWTCSAATQSCLPPSAQIVTWQVGPLLVRSGNPVQITWKARNVASCAVQGTNGDGSDGTWTGLSGTRTSSNITQQTTYSLVCQALAGAQPQTVASSTIVNIVPVFTEP